MRQTTTSEVDGRRYAADGQTADCAGTTVPGTGGDAAQTQTDGSNAADTTVGGSSATGTDEATSTQQNASTLPDTQAGAVDLTGMWITFATLGLVVAGAVLWLGCVPSRGVADHPAVVLVVLGSAGALSGRSEG